MKSREKLDRKVETPYTFRWLGVGGVQLRYGDRILLIDPFLSRPSFKQVLFKCLRPNVELLRQEIPTADAILVTHAHYDHLMDVPAIIHLTGALAYGSENVVKLLCAANVPKENCVVIKAGDCFEVYPFRVQVIEGRHITFPFFKPKQLPQIIAPPRRVWDYQMDACYSFSITLGEATILIWHSLDIGGAIPAQVLIIDAELSLNAFKHLIQRVKPNWVIPIHWDDFFRPLSAPLKPFFRPPERTYFWIGRIDPPSYVGQLQKRFPGGRVFLPQLLKEVDLNDLIAGQSDKSPPQREGDR